MYNLHVLRDGWNKHLTDSDQLSSGCTISLLRGPKFILIDPGSPWDTAQLVEWLKSFDITPETINYVVCTHEHLDHTGSLNLFTNAVHIVGTTILKDPRVEIMHDFFSYIPYEIDSQVKVIYTPGHTGRDVSVVVRQIPSLGRVYITGDLFECEEDLKDSSLWQNNSTHPEVQDRSRRHILGKADVIVPGHGPLFHVTSAHRHAPAVILT